VVGRARALAAALAVVASGCGTRERVFVPVAYLVDTARGERPRAPLATIDRDTRPVLRDWPGVRIFDGREMPLPADGRLPLRIPVPPALRRHAALVLEVFAMGNPHLDSYRPAFGGTVAVEGAGDAASVALELRIDPRRAWRARGRAPDVSVFVVARAPPERSVAVDLPALGVPRGARLDLSLGILEAGWDQGPAAFRVLACAAPERCTPLFDETLDPAGPERGRWRERRVDLGAHAGREIRLRFETETLGPGHGFPLFADPVLLREKPRGPEDRDLLLISLDTLRADHLPSYGYPRETAPFLASLAARGTLFESALASAPSTTPSHMTLLTSLVPSVHGLLGNDTLAVLPPRAETLAEALRRAGFATAAVSEGGGLMLGTGFERGFGTWIENPLPVPHRPGLQSPVTFDRGREWLRARADRRTFLFLHTYEVHGPYRAPDAYGELFPTTPPGLEPDPRLRPSQRPVHYDREIRFVDDELRRLLAALEAEGRLRRSLVVVTSDHGEEFLEHGWIGHGARLPEEVLRVPLVFVGAGIAAGRRIATPVGLVDLAPTLLDLLHAPPFARAMGRSLAPLLRGAEPDAALRERPLFAETWFRQGFGPEGPKPVDQPSYSVRVGSRKLVRLREGERFRYAYYDLARDPGERRDLYAADPAGASDLRALVDAYPLRAVRLREALLDGEAEERPLEPERESQLRALGYVE
jgi:arylsulfatase A-like enzyme